MTSKTYWLMSDRKTVREVSWKKYSKLRDGKRNVKLAIVWEDEMYIFETSADGGISLHRRQLDQIWRTEPCSSE